jgi:hypothetical protein
MAESGLSNMGMGIITTDKDAAAKAAKNAKKKQIELTDGVHHTVTKKGAVVFNIRIVITSDQAKCVMFVRGYRFLSPIFLGGLGD